MKFEKRHIVIAFLFLYIFTLTFSTIGIVHATETIYKHVVSTNQTSLSLDKYYLYLDDDTPLTYRYFKENPDYTITVIGTGKNYNLCVVQSDGKEVSLRYVSVSSAYDFNYASIPKYYAEQNIDCPLILRNSATNNVFTINSNVDYSTGGSTDTTDPTDPEETTPVVPPEDDGEDTAGLLDGLLDGIKSFFTELFKPITDLIESWQKLQESETTIWDALGLLYDYVKGYTFEPIFEFFESIVGNDALYLIVQIWNFPVIKELLIAVVAILVISGFIRLITTL